ncbi:MAG TPA: hypothetical protein VII39_14305, partial [Bradyrhizobium sp.]
MSADPKFVISTRRVSIRFPRNEKLYANHKLAATHERPKPAQTGGSHRFGKPVPSALGPLFLNA